MTRIIGVALVALLAASLAKIFSVDDTLIQLIVLGRIPGTEVELSFMSIALLYIPMVFVISITITTFRADLIESKLKTIRKESISSYEDQIVVSKQKQAAMVAQQLDIDELDAISL